MNDYVVIVDLGKEAIALGADSEQDAIQRAREIISETYGSDTLADTASYEVEA